MMLMLDTLSYLPCMQQESCLSFASWQRKDVSWQLVILLLVGIKCYNIFAHWQNYGKVLCREGLRNAN